MKAYGALLDRKDALNLVFRCLVFLMLGFALLHIQACFGVDPETTFKQYCFRKADCHPDWKNSDVEACIIERLDWYERASNSDSPVECPGFRDDLFQFSDCMLEHGSCQMEAPLFYAEECGVFDPTAYACAALRS